ncbi:type II toxin-antitoxin system mRNA interferase toxin, RelE/StbE family [Picosynechococcus sp. NKBG15041c]|uniref:type II toxin-antitoxin system mRNA interferase toxin, RelE/StbE family n=1 Tax=Picosynechococcus sp. NKBG15041c TaxID=1407650 RepID=UPI000429E4FB|nr:type II toxin-antitoxin system mRNA interferase toxin, RelE/StbE family [Picosynechococcus sp. NKBG15041c]
MTWQITFTSNFLKSIYSLPKAVRNKLPDVMRALENDPSPKNGYSLKIKGRSLWRIRISRRYRLFYQYHESWIKLIKVALRNEHTYKNGALDEIEKEGIEESNIPDWFIDDVIEDEFQHIDEKMLKVYDVPKIYWDELIKLGKERDEEKYQDNLIEYIVNHVSDPEAQEQILNCCTNQLLNQSEHQASYFLSQQDYASLFFSIDNHFSQENKLPDLILQLSEEQKKVLELPFDKPILVKGGAGTGKTVLAVHKASEIARSQKKSGDNSKILFVTYTYSLVTYIRELLESLTKNK